MEIMMQLHTEQISEAQNTNKELTKKILELEKKILASLPTKKKELELRNQALTSQAECIPRSRSRFKAE